MLTGYSRVPLRAASNSKLSRTSLRVLIALGRFSNNLGESFPSLKTIAEHAALDRRHVPAALHELELAGLITRSRRRDKDGDFNSTYYTIIYDEVTPAEVSGVTSTGDTGSTPRRDTVTPRSSMGVTSPGALRNPLKETHLRNPIRADARNDVVNEATESPQPTGGARVVTSNPLPKKEDSAGRFRVVSSSGPPINDEMISLERFKVIASITGGCGKDERESVYDQLSDVDKAYLTNKKDQRGRAREIIEAGRQRAIEAGCLPLAECMRV
jgi:hypothetical protein